MSDKTPLELAKRVIGAINHLDNPLMSDLKILAAALIENRRHALGVIADYFAMYERICDAVGAQIGDIHPDELATAVDVMAALNKRLRGVCGEAYQMAGALEMPVAVLDNLSDAAMGAPLRHETFLPLLDTDSDVVKRLMNGQDPDEKDDILAAAFADEDYRYAYAEDFLNAWVATQIVTLREQRGLNQTAFGKLIGTKQPGVSRLEDVNHSTWKTETLTRIARALGVRLKISFETFGTLLEEDRRFNRDYLKRLDFHEDPAFSDAARAQKENTDAK